MRASLLLASSLAASACVNAPRPTPEARALQHNARAIVEGRVTDIQGRPVAGLRVEGVPLAKDVAWSPAAVTDSNGRFTLALVAPGQYGFVLRQGARIVVTDDPRDPSRARVQVHPGQRRGGIELLFLREEWNAIPKERTPGSSQ